MRTRDCDGGNTTVTSLTSVKTPHRLAALHHQLQLKILVSGQLTAYQIYPSCFDTSNVEFSSPNNHFSIQQKAAHPKFKISLLRSPLPHKPLPSSCQEAPDPTVRPTTEEQQRTRWSATAGRRRGPWQSAATTTLRTTAALSGSTKTCRKIFQQI